MRKKTQSLATTPSFSAERFMPVLLVLVVSLLFMVRMTGPDDLMAHDQEPTAAYVLDCTVNHNWVCQRDWTGELISTPPLYNWVAAAATLTLGRGTINRVTLYLPSFLAIFGTALLIYRCGKKVFGWQTSALGALFFILSPATFTQVALAQPDALFTFTIALAAFTGYTAWTTGRGWIGFWLAAALSGLTNGVAGLFLASTGFASWFWNHRSENKQPVFPNVSIAGAVLFLGVVAGWFLLAYHNVGHELYQKLITQGLIEHAFSPQYGVMGRGLLLAPTHLIIALLPWSLFGILACIQTIRNPSQQREAKRLERFLVCWAIGGTLLLGLTTYQRAGLVGPMLAPLSLLAARLITSWIPPKWLDKDVTLFRISAIIACAGILLMLSYSHFILAKQPIVFESKAMEKAAANIKEIGINPRQLHFYETPFALQFHLNTMTPATPAGEVLPLLESSTPQLLIVRNLDQLKELAADSHYRVIYRWTLDGEPFLFLIANAAYSQGATRLNSHTRPFSSATLYTD